MRIVVGFVWVRFPIGPLTVPETGQQGNLKQPSTTAYLKMA